MRRRPLLDATAGRVTFEMLGAEMSRSADLSYTYGKYSNVRRKGTEEGHYFQIWQTDDSRSLEARARLATGAAEEIIPRRDSPRRVPN